MTEPAARGTGGVAISVCIVSWNTCEFLRACLSALDAAHPADDIEVIVVDNASSDGSAAMVRSEFPEVTLLPQGQNLMFGPGANLAAKHARGRYVVFLNSDAELSPGQARAMVRYLDEHPTVGACSCQQEDGRGHLWPLPRPLHTVRAELLKAVGLRRLLPARPSEPQAWLSGSCTMVRRDLGEKLGYFDPAYTFYMEDADLCLRIREAGSELRLVPGLVVIHRHGRSSHQRDCGERLLWHTAGFCRLVLSHQPPGRARVVLLIRLLTSVRDGVAYHAVALLTLGAARAARSRARVARAVVGTVLCGLRQSFGGTARAEPRSGS